LDVEAYPELVAEQSSHDRLPHGGRHNPERTFDVGNRADDDARPQRNPWRGMRVTGKIQMSA
jgi:hypothetical protein